MSLTSCFKYILELPAATLTDTLNAALSESDSAGVQFTQNWTDIPVGSYTAKVSVKPADRATHPASLVLTAVDLGVILHLQMTLSVNINELPQLSTITYLLNFDLLGNFLKDTSTPPKLLMIFPAVTSTNLNLVVEGGYIILTADLIEPRIHAAYAADPSLAHDVQHNVPWPPGPDSDVLVTTDIYDDQPGSPGFRGAITVQILDQHHVLITMPGHFRVQGLAQPNYINTDMTINITVGVEPIDGSITLKFSNVQTADVVVTFATSSIYDIGAKPTLASNIATKLRILGDKGQDIPTNSQVHDMISDRLVAFSTGLQIPLFTPHPPADPTQIDLTTFVPATVNQQALALQLEQLTDGTPCDTPDVFTQTTGFAIAISAGEANTLIQPITADNLGDRTVDGHDITMNHLYATLSDPGAHGQVKGHIWISGDFDVHVDCWPDPNITFSGPIFLTPQTNPDGMVVFTAQAGNFDSSDACCANMDPAKIAALIQGKQSTPISLPTDFSGVGKLTLAVTSADIFAAGIVVNGTFNITTNHSLHKDALRKTLAWYLDTAGGNK